MDDSSVPQNVIFFHGAFVHYITPGDATAHPQDQSRTSASLRKLAGFSDKHLIELSADMYDELQRRLNPERAEAGPLSPRHDIHWKRNDARKHVGSLPASRFHEICRDLITEQERRYSDLTTGPTYPLQDATPMRDLQARLSQGDTGDGSRSSTESRPRLNISTDHVMIQSVNESNVTPTKVQIVESDSEYESDDDDQPSNTPVFAELLNPSESSEATDPESPTDAEHSRTSQASVPITEGVDSEPANDSRSVVSKAGSQSSATLASTNGEAAQVRDRDFENGALGEPRDSKFSDIADSNASHDDLTVVGGDDENMRPDTQSTPQTTPNKRDLYPMSPPTSSGASSHKGVDRTPASAASLQSEEYEALKIRLDEQRTVTEQVRKDAARFLEEMRALTELHEKQISRADGLDAEVTHWKNRHAKTAEELEKTRHLRIEAAIAVPVIEDSWPEEMVSSTGKIETNDMHRFMSAISVLVSAVHKNLRSKNLLELLHQVVLASQSISKDDKLMIRAVKQLISVVRNYTVSKGLFPRILVDSACSDITIAVLEFAKQAGVRASPASVKPSEHEQQEQKQQERGVQEPKVEASTHSESPNDEALKSDSMLKSTALPKSDSARLQASETDVGEPPASQVQGADSRESVSAGSANELEDESSYDDVRDADSASQKPQVLEHKANASQHSVGSQASSISIDSKLRSLDLDSAKDSSAKTTDRETSPSSEPRMYWAKQGPELGLDESVQKLQTYLEDHTSGTVESIGSLLSGIKVNAVAGELKPLVVQIRTLASEMIEVTEQTLAETRSRVLKDKGSFILQNLRDCLARMEMLREEELEAIRSDAKPNRHLKQRLAGASFDMAKSTKELVKTVEEVVLQNEVEHIDSKLL